MPIILPAKPGILPLACIVLLLGCAHPSASRPVPSSPASRALASEAMGVLTIACEEDYFDAKLIFQALPENSDEHAHLRAKMLEYLLGPLAGLDAETLRRNPSLLGVDDDFDRLQSSFREALDLFLPSSLWQPNGPSLSARERKLLVDSARLLVAAYSPRGSELPVATALFVLLHIEPQSSEWPPRLDQLLSWAESGAQLSGYPMGPHRQASSTDLLENVAAVWPSPSVLAKLTEANLARQNKVAGLLRRPLDGEDGVRGLLSEFLLDTEPLSAMAVTAASRYLRCGQLAKANEVARGFADKTGDDPELRQLLATTATEPVKASVYLALARRFLPRNELLRGTSTDRLDPQVALGVLRRALTAYPDDPEALLLASRVARMLASPLLSLRYLDEAIAATPKTENENLRELAAERMDLAFLRLKMHIDPEHLVEAEREANKLRAQLAEGRGRYGADHFRQGDADIDTLLAGGMVDAGEIDKAAPLLQRARQGGESSVDVARQLASLSIKRGEPQQAIALLQQTFDFRARNAPAEDTIPYVEGQAKLSYLLGIAFDVAADAEAARKAWASAARGWERLMLEQLRRKNLSASAEATFEVGRLYYLLGRREEGIRKLDEAIAQDEERDQSYLDSISFLVQRGERMAAVDIYRRALSKPGRAVSEYVKVYASMWIVDITRRGGSAPDPGAISYLRAIGSRKIHLRPARAEPWYRDLALFATDQIPYATLLARADTSGKRAEAYFYEAMRRLSTGQREEAHALWSKVVETKMFSFFEFDMAARYLRTGAPARPESNEKDENI